jgi:putative phosphoesterase
MRVAALYDIHGNLPALEAAMDDIRAARMDQVIVGGDVVLGPMPRETLAYLSDLDIPTQFIQGNCDRYVLEEARGTASYALPPEVLETIRWVARELGPEVEGILAGWPSTLRVEIPGLNDVLFCHATPRSDTEIFLRTTPDDRVSRLLDGVDASVVVCGHTHMQFDRTVGKTRVVNAGSVGMPVAEPGAHWVLLGPDVELRRTSYDLSKAAELIGATAYPGARDYAEHNILHPPTEEKMLEVFARKELQ